ncbi:MAG: hypothetical protein BWY82_02559 [Verrucomicrobia bacterium ADurb.Bin474]|nr:MAG: hypothetical protein BWY82_02559 [Verrucomicrobia bacterium ADurb.Bin474]
MGTALTPAEPINGLILFFEKRFMNLAIRTPPAVATTNAKQPNATIIKVCGVRKYL